MIKEQSYLNLLEESFPGVKANFLRWEALGFSCSKPFLKKENGEFVSHVGFIEYPLFINGHEHKAGAFHAICTKSTHRNQGLASTLIQEALNWGKNHYEYLILFTDIPEFYEKLSFHSVQEYRFHLACQHVKGSQSLIPVVSPKDDLLFKNIFKKRASLSNHVWMQDYGTIASFNALFATYPTYGSIYYSESIDGFISYIIENQTLHLFDVIAEKIPSLKKILDHFSNPINEIYFYFSPDRLTNTAMFEPYLYDNGHLMVYGNFPNLESFMISPLSRC